MKKIITVMITILMIVIIVNPGCKKKDDNNGNGGGDTTSYFTLAQVGHQWIYRITSLKGACDYNVEVTKDMGNHIYELLYQKGSCDWAVDNYTAFMFCSPEEWGSVNNLNPLDVQVNLRTDANVGTVYTWINSPDTISVTVLNLHDQITVPAGQFDCVKVLKEGNMNSPSDTTDFAAYYWITYKYGLVKLENIFGPPGIDQQLVSANW